ncbi:MAG: serine hydrolase domain-containing protein [Solirubrobacteraceae bacterium]
MAVLVIAAGVVVVIGRVTLSPAGRGPQQILDALVSGPQRVAPGATAYVTGPNGTWVGAAGIANIKTGQRMRPDARLRIQSNSKTWLLAVALQLMQEGKLNFADTVSRWLPGLLPHGNQINLLELMTDTSGLIDDNDVLATPSAGNEMLSRVKNAKLRAELRATAGRLAASPATPVSPMWFIRLAAWQPLLFTPGTRYHHSNIGWNIAGLIVARAAGQSLPALYRERIFKPLGLTHTTYAPQGPIPGPHAEGYLIARSGRLSDTTDWTFGKGADGAIVTDATDEATFLHALLDNELGVREAFLAFVHPTGWKPAKGGCPGNPDEGTGAGDASRSYVYYSTTGSNRIAVLLVNGKRAVTGADEPEAEAAAASLYCGA